MKEFKYNLVSMLLRIEFYFSIFILLGIQFFQFYLNIFTLSNSQNSIADTYPAIYQTSLLNNNIPFGLISLLAIPVCLSFIYSDASFNENKSGISQYLYNRLNRSKDWISKTFLVFITTFIVCFLSLGLNALLCYFIYENGSFGDIFGSNVYQKMTYPFLFLEELRLQNNNVYLISILIHYSIIMSLLSVFSLQLSLYVKNKIYIYFSTSFIILGLDALLSILNLSSYSICQQIQYPGSFSINNVFISGLALLGINIIFILINICKVNNDL